MALFYTQRNHGILAVISAADARLYGVIMNSGGCPFKSGVRVFTFRDPDVVICERGKDHPSDHDSLHDRHVLTGDMKLLEKLRCHTFEQNSPNTGWDGNVPFSNQEHRQNHERWLRYRTTVADFVEKFELLS